MPVALMQPDQSGAMGGQAYMLVNRDDFPAMMGAGHGAMMPPGHAPAGMDDHKHDHDMNGDLMDVLVGAANRVEGGSSLGHGCNDDGPDDDDVDDDDVVDDERKAVEKQPLTTRSGRKRNPSRSF